MKNDTITLGGITYRIESVNHNQLQNDDYTLEHGCVFQLKDRQEYPCEYSPDGVVTAFKTDLIFSNPDSVMPMYWQKDWRSQGNANARYTRLVQVQS